MAVGERSSEDERERDPAATFDAVVDHLDGWEPDRATARGLREHLDGALNRGVETVWEREIVECDPGSTGPEVTVNGDIAVTFVETVGPNTVPELRRSLSSLAERYNFVVVYWHDPDPDGRGYRRSVEQSTSARRLDADGLAFVTPTLGTGERRSTGVGLPVAPSTGLAAVVVAAAVPAAWWLVVQTSGLAQFLLAGVGGLFVATLALGAFLGR
jgi:hypothetical protein